MSVSFLPPGLVALHGNHAETLAQTLAAWLQRQPLAPLESEVVLVQSNGMAEWIKLTLARQIGVCAATQVQLPSRFMWRTYRQVLGSERVPRESPLDKLPLTWRFMDLLSDGLGDAVFAPVRGFLQGGEPERLFQLASRLADLFDQYQIYRPDWLQDWALGHDVCRQLAGEQPLAPEHTWQPALWRCVLATLNDAERSATRPALHQRVLAHLQSGQALAQPVARRVSVFGMSHMPLQLLELLAALAEHSQVLLAVPNPCRYHWGDIMDGRQWLRSQRQRQRDKSQALATVDLADMHLHAPTLLASWGRQGRDFVRLLDAFDDAQTACQRQHLPTLDFFDDAPITPGTPMLAQLQRRIRDLVPSTAAHPAQSLPASDGSVLFRVAHSPVRELEVLHDQLLDWFAQPPGAQALSPRDVVVMVPDIESMAPAIDAVFGQYPRSDARHIPYAIADLGAQVNSPLIHALQWLLALPQERVHMSDWVALLEVPALAQRFGVMQESLPVLTRWMAGAGIRWGLSGEHRAGLGLGACGEVNTALFGLQRMLMGYACGADALPFDPQQNTVMPYAEVAGLDAELAGSLAQLLQTLLDWWRQSQQAVTPSEWAVRLRALLAQCFAAQSEADRQALQALTQALDDWLRACEGAGFAQPLPLPVVREAWLQALRMPQLAQRFRGGGVTFCTLMPMRAIPFRIVCLLGMNDGDYPRRAPQADFDLMALPGMARPGDRSRRDDDRQLMLEALLSARDVLYVSWCGRSVRDNSTQAPSVLVAQLRDEMDLLWGPGSAEARTQVHPLQPFGQAYFTPGSGVSTYAHEWAAQASPKPASPAPGNATSSRTPNAAPHAVDATPAPWLTLTELAQFLRRPVGTYFRQQLHVHLDRPQSGWLDAEHFALDPLERYHLLNEALNLWPNAGDSEAVPGYAQSVVQRLQASGALPLAGVGQQEAAQLQATLQSVLQAALAERAGDAVQAPRVVVDWPLADVHLHDEVSGLWQVEGQTPLLLLLRASGIARLTGNGQATPTPDKLIDAWLLSLATAAMGRSARVVVVGRNAVVRAPVWPQAQAQAVLHTLLQAWREGMRQPLPLPPALALAWLSEKKNPEQLRQAYEEGSFLGLPAVARQDPALHRCYPTWDTVRADGRFEAWAEPVYGPLLDWAAQCQAEPIGGEGGQT